MEELNFSTFLLQYKSGSIVPIVGSDLFRIINHRQSLEDLILGTLQATDNKGNIIQNFSELSYYVPNLENQVPAIYNQLQEHQIDAEMLKNLALLNKFKVFITSAYDRKLEDFLSDEKEIFEWNHEANLPINLDFTNNKTKLIYLFGRIKTDQEFMNKIMSFSDDDKLEALYKLSLTNSKSNSDSNYSLLEYLKGKTLLFIGNNFQDWFMRFALRILSNAPYNTIPRKIYIINDSANELNYEKFFFDKFKIELIHQYPIRDFITNFCNAINQNERLKIRYENKKVFISYDRDDFSDKITGLYNRARNTGIDIWLDTIDISAGEHKKEIETYLVSKTTRVFICFLSKSLVSKATADSYVKYHEWEIAKNRFNANKYLKSTGEKVNEFTIFPIALDDFNEYFNELPEFIKENHIYKIEDLENLSPLENLLK